jgi:hypothetical protein
MRNRDQRGLRMPAAGSGDSEAPDATVQTGPPADPDAVQADRERYADEAEQAVETIEQVLAGVKATLATAKADAKRLRAEADKGGES